MPNKEQIAAFYDRYVLHQRSVAFNERHWFLYELLRDCGLRSESVVLELGCGIGVMTALMARTVRTGRIVSVDISPKSIAAAEESMAGAVNVEFSVGDVVNYRRNNESFDFVTLFDVLEHIPIEEHPRLFGNLASFAAKGALILINIPSPSHIEYLRDNEPELLQVIDQPLPANHMVDLAYSNALELRFFSTYNVWSRGDYQVMAFAKRTPFTRDPLPRESRYTRFVNRLVRQLLRQWRRTRGFCGTPGL